MSLKDVVNTPESGAGRIFALTIQGLIILSMISFSIETLPDLAPQTRAFLRAFEIFSIAIFSAEYILRIIAAEKPFRFIFSFLGIIDLLAIAPFYLSTGLDLRVLRGFRLLRLFRIFKLVRYSNAVRRYHRAFVLSREELVLFASTSLIILFMSGAVIYYFENPVQPEIYSSMFQSLWWAIITLTTVGYGDMVPITAGGQIFTCLILIVGIGVIAVPTAILSSALSAARDEETNGDTSS